MTRMRLVGSVLSLTLLAASPAAAQLCTGNPSLAYSPYQVSIAASFNEGARSVDLGAAAGGQTIFGGAGLTIVNFTDIDVKTAGVFGYVGAELAADRDSKIMICPIARLTVLAGPDIGPVDSSTTGLEGGGAIGLTIYDVGDIQVVPFFGLAVTYTRLRSEFAGVTTTVSDTGGRADLGVGFMFNRTAGITPSISIPFETGNSDTTFTIRFSYNFGR
ncbi:MAG TPA: hypothetical protein VKB50_04315 [Vicinamibacterales bacterium]|nr:hypothetical protein [Vicinamibacterales bacterium]